MISVDLNHRRGPAEDSRSTAIWTTVPPIRKDRSSSGKSTRIFPAPMRPPQSDYRLQRLAPEFSRANPLLAFLYRSADPLDGIHHRRARVPGIGKLALYRLAALRMSPPEFEPSMSITRNDRAALADKFHRPTTPRAIGASQSIIFYLKIQRINASWLASRNS